MVYLTDMEDYGVMDGRTTDGGFVRVRSLCRYGV